MLPLSSLLNSPATKRIKTSHSDDKNTALWRRIDERSPRTRRMGSMAFSSTPTTCSSSPLGPSTSTPARSQASGYPSSPTMISSSPWQPSERGTKKRKVMTESDYGSVSESEELEEMEMCEPPRFGGLELLLAAIECQAAAPKPTVAPQPLPSKHREPSVPASPTDETTIHSTPVQNTDTPLAEDEEMEPEEFATQDATHLPNDLNIPPTSHEPQLHEMELSEPYLDADVSEEPVAEETLPPSIDDPELRTTVLEMKTENVQVEDVSLVLPTNDHQETIPSSSTPVPLTPKADVAPLPTVAPIETPVTLKSARKPKTTKTPSPHKSPSKSSSMSELCGIMITVLALGSVSSMTAPDVASAVMNQAPHLVPAPQAPLADSSNNQRNSLTDSVDTSSKGKGKGRKEGKGQKKPSAKVLKLQRVATLLPQVQEVLSNEPMFGRVDRVGEDAAGDPLLPTYHYEPDLDPDQDRAMTIRAAGMKTKRRATKHHVQYHYAPISLNRFELAAECDDDD